MISLGGVIGQGLFLSAGANLSAAGKKKKKKSILETVIIKRVFSLVRSCWCIDCIRYYRVYRVLGHFLFG
jgi:hypothetical protein